jgi:hypothetical protein
MNHQSSYYLRHSVGHRNKANTVMDTMPDVYRVEQEWGQL